ncbi:MAG TPA: zinc ribbon domain-containing protein, partial [Ktedonobacteraceae bacterium]|nr:zinc ribbon domain-containing protein [Ktedonobacteraceae bacterium]
MTRTSRTTTRHHSTPTRQTFPCPTCSRISVMGDRFCGFCQEPLQLQCPTCGRWTKANHSGCPSCGTSLHDDGLSFDERRQLETLQQTSQDLRRAEAASARSLKAAHRGRRQAIMRLLWAGVLIGGILIGTIMIITSLVSSLAGMLLLFVGLFLFHRLFLWGLPRLVGHFWHWVAPGALADWQRAIEEIEEEQTSRAIELSHTEKERAALEYLIDPTGTGEEEEGWEDAEEADGEGEWEDAEGDREEENHEGDSNLEEEDQEETQEQNNQKAAGQRTGTLLTRIKALWSERRIHMARLARRVFLPRTKAQPIESAASDVLPAEEEEQASLTPAGSTLTLKEMARAAWKQTGLRLVDATRARWHMPRRGEDVVSSNPDELPAQPEEKEERM